MARIERKPRKKLHIFYLNIRRFFSKQLKLLRGQGQQLGQANQVVKIIRFLKTSQQSAGEFLT